MWHLKNKIAKIFVLIVILLSIPLFIKIADFSRFVIFTTGFHNLVSGIFLYYLKMQFFFLLLFLILITLLLVYLVRKIVKRNLYRDIVFLSGMIILLIELLPLFLLNSIKPELFYLYLMLLFAVFWYMILKKKPYDFLRSFFAAKLILFPVFAGFLMIGFNASAARPKTTIINGKPTHNVFDVLCDSQKFVSQKDVTPIWLEDAWLYPGVMTKDGRYVYFSDNGYGIIGFELSDDGKYKRLPSIRYPNDFNAALYSHRLYLTPDEKYLFYYGARSAEFVFINRERMEVAYVIPTENGLDGFSAAIDTKRNLIYGFPFIGKRIPVISYEEGVPRLTKWIDFSQIPGWAIQGVYYENQDKIIIFTSSYFGIHNPEDYRVIKSVRVGPVLTRFALDEKKKIYFSNEFAKRLTVIDLDELNISYIDGIPSGIREIFLDINKEKILLSQFSSGKIFIYDIQSNKIVGKIYVGPRPRSAVLNPQNNLSEKWLLGSSCGVFSFNNK